MWPTIEFLCKDHRSMKFSLNDLCFVQSVPFSNRWHHRALLASYAPRPWVVPGRRSSSVMIACLTPPPPSTPSEETTRSLPLLALPMTAGNDVLFPGCSQMFSLGEESAQRVLSQIVERDPPEFGYVTLNAWGDPANVGTIGIVDDFRYVPNGKSMLSCSGVARFRVEEFDDDLASAKLQIFHDELPADDQCDHLASLENQLVSAMKDIISLSIKISDDNDHTRQRALEETISRIESLVKGDDSQQVDHWLLDMGPDRRREILSFIVIDLLDISFMDRRSILENTNTADRLGAAYKGLKPLIRELAAKGAIVGALGRNDNAEGSESAGTL